MSSHNLTRHKVHKHQLRGPISNIRSGWLIQPISAHTWSHHPAGQKDTTTPWSWDFFSSSQRNGKWPWNWDVTWYSTQICHGKVRGMHICMGGQLRGKSWSWRSNQFPSYNQWPEGPVVGIRLRHRCLQTTNIIQGSWVNHNLLLLKVLRNLKAASNRKSKKMNNYQLVPHEVSSNLARELSCLWETWLPDLQVVEILSARASLLLCSTPILSASWLTCKQKTHKLQMK